MQMQKRPILSYNKFNSDCLPSYTISDTDPTVASFSLGKSYVSDYNTMSMNVAEDVSVVVSQSNSEHSWPELVNLIVSKPPSNALSDLLNSVPLIDNNSSIDVAVDASVLGRVASDQTSPEDICKRDCSRGKVSKINKEWIFVMTNFVIELLSATFDQLSSVHKPRYALIAMLMSFVACIVCIIEFAYKTGKEKVTWRWTSKLPWFYYSSPSNKLFGTFPEIIGLICAILQSILSAIVYIIYLQHSDYPIKISFWPLVFSLGLLCSKFMQNSDPKGAFGRD